MRCKIHPSDAGNGVCALCLRERLSALASAVSNATDAEYSPDFRRKLGRFSPPQPPLFPRSASPHAFGLRPADDYHPRSHRPPRHDSAASGDSDGGSGGRRRRGGRFSLFSFLFGRHRETGSDFEAEKLSRSSSWLSAIIRGRRRRRNKKKMSSRLAAEEKEEGEARRKMNAMVHGRGMSPAEKSEVDYESEGGYMTDPSAVRRQDASPPIRLAANHHGHRKASGLGMLFSPLMRPSPAPSEVGFSGELRGTFNTQRHRLSNASAPDSSGIGPNRSRKIADFGKFR